MKKIIFSLMLVLPVCVFAQIGLKAGLNFANVTKASSINSSSKSGFHAGVFLAPGGKKILGFRTELIYSKQGYNYKTSTNNPADVSLDYILMPQLTTINITKYFQLQLGAQMAFLINAKVDSTGGSSTGNAQADKFMEFYNRFDYGFAGGLEVHPIKGLLIGARVNISLGNMYKDMANPSGEQPSFMPKVDAKNNVFQIFAGWKFGK